MAMVIRGGLRSAAALNLLVLPALYWLYGERAVARERQWTEYAEPAVGYVVIAAAPAWPVIFVGLLFIMCWTSMASPTLFAVVGDALPAGLVAAFVVGGLREIGEPARKAPILDLLSSRRTSSMRYDIRHDTRHVVLAAAVLGMALRPDVGHAQGAAAADWAAVDRALGRPGTAQPGEVQKYSFPRGDLHVTVGGVAVKPALALGSWVAFKRMGSSGREAMAMGDLVLTEAEVPAVVAKLQTGGIQQTALHNHLQHEAPRVMYLHIEGRGDPAKLAEVIRAALATTKTPAAAAGPGAQGASPFSLDTAAMARALQRSGTVTGGVYQVSVPRAEPVRAEGIEIPPAMGVATAINFQPTGNGKAAITGDFVLTADEVNPVLRTLEQQGIAVTALHSHMLTEEPRLLFMHFWANDDALRLARGLRMALEHTKAKPAGS